MDFNRNCLFFFLESLTFNTLKISVLDSDPWLIGASDLDPIPDPTYPKYTEPALQCGMKFTHFQITCMYSTVFNAFDLVSDPLLVLYH
jgi:hypothetical protein